MLITKTRLRQIIKEELESLNKLKEAVPPESQTRVSPEEIKSIHQGVDELLTFLKRAQDPNTLHKAVNNAWEKGVLGRYAPAKKGTPFNQRSRAEKIYWKLINRVVKVKKAGIENAGKEFAKIKNDLNVMVADYNNKHDDNRTMATGGAPTP